MGNRYIASIVIISFLLASCTGQGGDQAGDNITIKVAHNGNEQHPFQRGFEAFNESLQDQIASGTIEGSIEVTVFPSSQLGSEESAIEQIKMGTLNATAASAAGMAPFVKDVDVLNYPFIFEDLDHFYRVLDGPVGDRISKRVEEELDCVVLGWWFSGIRNVWNSERPIIVPSDLNGLKIRVIDSPVVMDTFEALGAQATRMSFGELYSAVQTGVLDGGESDHTDLLVEKFHEVSKYVSLTEHLYLAAALIYSKKKFDQLSPEMQQAVVTAGKASVELQRRAMEKMNEESLVALKELGLEFNEVDGEKFREMVANAKVYENNAEGIGGMSVVQEVKDQ